MTGGVGEARIVASSDRCTVYPQHRMVNQGRSEQHFADLSRCDCGREDLGTTDESRYYLATQHSDPAVRATYRQDPTP